MRALHGLLLSAGIFWASTASASPRDTSVKPSPSPDLLAVAEEAYVYGYPLVLMDATKRAMTAVSAPGPRGAPINQFLHARSTPTPSTRWVVRPNLDTLYATAWLDLSREPIVLHIPAVKSRFYLLQVLDAWTNVFADPGTRTIGGAEKSYAIVGPHWQGTLPADLERIQSPTNMAWIISRTQVNGSEDEAAARAIEVQYTLNPLSAWERGTPAPKSEPVDMQGNGGVPPPEQVARMDGVTFFSTLAELMRDNPAPASNAPALAKFAALGFAPGQPFRPSPEVERVVQEVPANMLRRISEHVDRSAKLINGWSTLGTEVGAYGTNYAIRAAVAMKGLGANLAVDAIYLMASVDANGQPLQGRHGYVLHLEPGQMPPVDAFWSVTLYGEDGYLVENPLRRYALRDRDPLKRNADGSLDLVFQHEPPAANLEANWLPAPAGAFNLLLRLYLPKKQAMDGSWQPPAIRRR